MAEADIIEQLTSRPGQSQQERLPAELRPHFVDIDERAPSDVFAFLQAFAAHLNYYATDIVNPAGTWKAFLETPPGADAAKTVTELLRRHDGTAPAHLALLLTFLQLLEVPRRAINELTAKHVRFQYRDVLGFAPRGPVPDRAHVVFELKKGLTAEEIKPEHTLSAGKDARGVELIYAPKRSTVLHAATVAELRSVYVDRSGRGKILCAPRADSADGLGSPLVGEEQQWPGFGHDGLPPADIGFAIASPVFRMKEGTRSVTVQLELVDAPPSLDTRAFQVLLTGEKGWLGPYPLAAGQVVGGVLTLAFAVPAADGAVVDYDPKVHKYSFAAAAPIAQFRLDPDGSTGYFDASGALLTRANVRVTVSGITTLTLESDAGALNPKKAFLPFGPQPIAGSRFMVGCEEALSKKLTAATLSIEWQGLPAAGLADLYSKYDSHPGNDGFTATVTLRDGTGHDRTSPLQSLFEPPPSPTRELQLIMGGTFSARASGAVTTSRAPWRLTGLEVHSLTAAGSAWARALAQENIRIRPWLGVGTASETRPGFITLTLDRDFLHADYRTETIRNALQYGAKPNGLTILKEPYTPTIRQITLGYTAQSEWVAIDSNQVSDFSDPDLQFFHVGCFGQMREHGYQRHQLAYVPDEDKRVPLLPVYRSDGELLIGISGLKAGDGVSLLVQVAEGSADPDLPRPAIVWFALCDNYWKRLEDRQVTLDTTDALLRSGLLQFVLPPEVTDDNTILPSGLVWLKAALTGSVDGVCELVAVVANGVEVEFQDKGNDPGHLLLPLPAAKLTKLKNGPATVKTVTQPYASFGGAPAESADALTQRAAERLRHRGRAITAWDYERLVLDAFPAVHRAKCLSHAKDGAWLAPGNVLLVVVPDLRNLHARDPLRPKVDADTIQRIKRYLEERTGEQVNVRVKSPTYQSIALDFAVRFRRGFEFTYSRQQLERQLIQFLSPWAFASDRTLSFGGRVYRSVLLDFVETQDSVDYVADFKMYSYTATPPGPDVSQALPQAPDVILVSAPAHTIREIP